MSDEPILTPMPAAISDEIKAELDALIEQANIEMGRPSPGAEEESDAV
jgi:hypothetical protein